MVVGWGWEEGGGGANGPVERGGGGDMLGGTH